MDKDLVKELNDLAQVDVDAYHAYAQAIEAIKDTEIKEKLMSFHCTYIATTYISVIYFSADCYRKSFFKRFARITLGLI